MSDRPYIAALDQGTSGTRFVVFDVEGTPVSGAFTSHQPDAVAPNRLEYDPLRLWGCATDAIRRGLVEASVGAEQLRTLGISSQRQTLLVWEASSGDPVTRALSWQDRRASEVIEALNPEERRLVRDRTGLVPDAYFAAPKATWLLDHGGERRLRQRAAAGEVLLGTIDAWLLYNLTGAHATDVTNAAQTMLFDVHELAWDEELLALFDVPRAALPTVHPSSDSEGFGTTDPDGILNTAVPITGVMGDQQAALLGRGGFGPGDAKVTYGTGNFFLQNTGREPVDAGSDLLTTVWFQHEGEDPYYGLEGPVFATGAVLEWLRAIGLLEGSDAFDSLADDPAAVGSVSLVPSFGGLGAPEWVSGLGTTVFGLHRGTDREDLVRAAVESIAFGTRAVVEAAETATNVDHGRLLVDGGAVQDDDFAQLQTDFLDRSLVRAGRETPAALGAALAAGLGAGIWDSLEDAPSETTPGQTFDPSVEPGTFDDAFERWRDVVETATAVRSAQRHR